MVMQLNVFGITIQLGWLMVMPLNVLGITIQLWMVMTFNIFGMTIGWLRR
jgi:hypothetical protein